MRARWADPLRRARQISGIRNEARRSGRAWWAAEDLILRELGGTVPAREIVRTLAERGFVRSLGAVYARAEQRGVDLFKVTLSLNEVHHVFRVGIDTVKAWVGLSLLPTRSYGQAIVVSEDDLAAFIRAYPWAYDAERMPPGRWRQLASVAQQRDPWLRTAEAAALVGCGENTVKRHIGLGVGESRRRPGIHGLILVRASSIPALKAVYRSALARSVAQLVPGARFGRLRERAA